MRLIPLRQNPQYIEQFIHITSEDLEAGTLLNHKVVAEKLCDSNLELFLFEANAEFVGFAEVALEEKCFPDEDLPEVALRILSFYIRPQFRGQKLGSHAFKLLRHWGHDNNAAIVEVETGGKETSDRFLSKQGLELVGQGSRNIYRAFI